MIATRFLPALVLIVAFVSGCNSGTYMQEGMPHAEAIVRNVTQNWNADKLVEVADPRMLAAFSEPQIREMMAICAKDLGNVKSQETIASTTGIETSISGQVATYSIDVRAEKGNARITIKLQKVNKNWNVLGFWINKQNP